MDSEKKKVISNSLYYSLGNVLLKLFSFFLIPLYTAYLTTEQYGIINLANSFISLISSLIMCGFQYAAIRYYADIKDNESGKKRLISTIINFLILLGFGFALILLFSMKLWHRMVFAGINQSFVILSILISCITGLYYVYQELLKGMQKAKISMSLTYLYFFLLLLCNLISVVILKSGAFGILLSNLIVVIIMIGIMFYNLIRTQLYYIGLDKGLLMSMLKYSLPLVPHTVAFNISNLYSRIAINTKLSTSMLGLYSLASQFGAIADQVSNAVQSAFQPWLFQELKKIENGEKQNVASIRSLTDMLLWIYGGIFVMIGGWSQDVIQIFTTSSYHSAWIYVPVFIMSVAIKSPLYFYQNFMYYHKNLSRYIFMCTIIGCSISILLMSVLVPRIGIFGVIVSDIIALLCRLFITKWILRNVETIYSFLRVMSITIISIIWVGLIVLPSYIGLFPSNFVNIMYKLFMTLLYILTLLFIYRDQIRGYIKFISLQK